MHSVELRQAVRSELVQLFNRTAARLARQADLQSGMGRDTPPLGAADLLAALRTELERVA